MSDGDTRSEPGDLKSALARLDPLADASIQLHGILQLGLDKLPLPGSGATLQRCTAPPQCCATRPGGLMTTPWLMPVPSTASRCTRGVPQAKRPAVLGGKRASPQTAANCGS